MNHAADALQSSVDAEIERALRRIDQDYGAWSAAGIVRELRAVIFSGGKRMRPLLCCWGYQACGGKMSLPVVRAAASLELLHTFAILHDDIMDAPKARRRRPPVHEKVATEHRAGSGAAADRFGVSVAMLAGDLALVASDKLFMDSGFDAGRLAQAWEPLSHMRLDAIAGQYLDLSLSGEDVRAETAANIARLKSGSYSVRGPLSVGAALAGASDVAREALETFGENLGEAFQLADDLAGVFGDPEISGKDRESDLAQGKPTYLIALALELAPGPSQRAVRAAWNNRHATAEQIDAARGAIAASGAPGRVEDRIRRLVSRAKAAIEDPASKNLTAEPCSRLSDLADKILSHAGIPI